MTQDAQALIKAFLDQCDFRFGIAVSGGGDSMALLHLIAELRSSFRPHVITVNHSLRPEAADEAAFVARECEALGLSHTTLIWDGWDGQGNLQAAAREARYALLAGYAREHDLEVVLLGHTADDVAETFLMRLARGSGIEGLAPMRPSFVRNNVRFDRPLLKVSRADLRTYLKKRQTTWIEDPSNDDETYQRVKVRNVLPALDNAGLTLSRLQETTDRLADAREIVMASVRELASHAHYDVGGTVALDESATFGFHHEVRRLFWTKLVHWMGQADYPPRAEALRACLERARQEGRAQIGGCDVFYHDQTLTLMREVQAVGDVTGPTSAIWDGKWEIDGPHAEGLMVRTLGEDGLLQCPDWRDTGCLRQALMATPAVYQGDRLVAAPLAGLQNGWSAQIVADFASYLASH